MLKASMIGNLGNDLEMKYSANGAPFLRFNVARHYRTRTPEGEWTDKTEWVRCTIFGQRAESLSQILKKGMRVFVDGRLEARPWTDREGAVRAGLEVVASDVEFMSSRQDDQPVTDSTASEHPRQPADAGNHGDDVLEDLPF